VIVGISIPGSGRVRLQQDSTGARDTPGQENECSRLRETLSRALGSWGFSGYHWLVIAAAWAGWGIRCFRRAPVQLRRAPTACPCCLGLCNPEHRVPTRGNSLWTGTITSILLVGWAAGGVFVWLACRPDRTPARPVCDDCDVCAGTAFMRGRKPISGNSLRFARWRASVSAGNGGLVPPSLPRTVPESRRVRQSRRYFGRAPRRLGIVLASTVNYWVAGVWFAATPQTSWRYVFLAGPCAGDSRVGGSEYSYARALTGPAADAREHPPSPARTVSVRYSKADNQRRCVAVTAVVSWWACNAFVPLLGSTLAGEHAARYGSVC